MISKKVAYFYGCFANYYYPDVAKSLVSILEFNGIEQVIPSQKCCALPIIANGNYKLAKSNAEFNINELSCLVGKGYEIVTTCTSCSLMIKNGYPKYFDSEKTRLVSSHTYTIEEYLMQLHDHRQLNMKFRSLPFKVAYHSPCHQRAQIKHEGTDKTLDLLKILPGLSVAYISDTCCGMGGSYGFKASNYKLSQDIGAHIFSEIKSVEPDIVVTDCGGCKLQIEAGTGIKAIHPIILLEEACKQEPCSVLCNGD